MLYTKYESSGYCSFRQEFFLIAFWKTHFLTPWPTFATNQNHLNNFGRGPPSDHSCWVWSNYHWRFKKRCRLNFSLYNPMLNCNPRGGVYFNPRGITWTPLVEELQMMLYTKYERSGLCSFRQEDIWKLHFENLFFDPVTFICNQSEPFEQFW